MAWSSTRLSIRRCRGLVVFAIRSSRSLNVLVGSMMSVMLFLPADDLTNFSTAARDAEAFVPLGETRPFLFRGDFQFCSCLVDLVVRVSHHLGGGHRLTLAGERFVGLVAEDLAEVGDRGA